MENKELKKKFWDDIKKETNIEDINNFFENCKNINEALPILQKINKYFLINYKLNFEYEGKVINIIPIETEIYFSKLNKDNRPDDGMCHMNDLQKGKDKNGNDRFGKLYFHRYSQKYKNDDSNKINYARGGVDVCISNSKDYYLSILIRSAFINDTKEENLYSGINNICKGIIRFYKPTKCLQCFFKELEVIEELVIKRRNKEVNITNLFEQPRISNKEYSKKNKENLNCLNLGKDYQYLNIINKKQTFYKKYNSFEKLKNYKESFNRN